MPRGTIPSDGEWPQDEGAGVMPEIREGEERISTMERGVEADADAGDGERQREKKEGREEERKRGREEEREEADDERRKRKRRTGGAKWAQRALKICVSLAQAR